MIFLGYLSKLKMSLKLVFGAYFLHDFRLKNVSYLTFYLSRKFQFIPFFPSQDIKQNVILGFYLYN